MQALTSDGKLWHRTAAEDTQLPYATVFLVSEVDETWTTSYAFDRASMQINVHAATDAAARAAAIAIRAAFHGVPLVIAGVNVAHVLPDTHGIEIGEGLGPNGRDCWVAIEVFDIAFSTE